MTVTVDEAKKSLPRLLRQVERGGEVIICRGKLPVAKIVPTGKSRVEHGAGGMEHGAGGGEWRAKSEERGAWGGEWGAESMGRGAGSVERGAGGRKTRGIGILANEETDLIGWKPMPLFPTLCLKHKFALFTFYPPPRLCRPSFSRSDLPAPDSSHVTRHTSPRLMALVF